MGCSCSVFGLANFGSVNTCYDRFVAEVVVSLSRFPFASLVQLCRTVYQAVPRSADGAGVFALLAKRTPGICKCRVRSTINAEELTNHTAQISSWRLKHLPPAVSTCGSTTTIAWACTSFPLTPICVVDLQAAVGEDGALPMSADPDPINILTTDAEVAGWNTDGLPNDQVCMLMKVQKTRLTHH